MNSNQRMLLMNSAAQNSLCSNESLQPISGNLDVSTQSFDTASTRQYDELDAYFQQQASTTADSNNFAYGDYNNKSDSEEFVDCFNMKKLDENISSYVNDAENNNDTKMPYDSGYTSNYNDFSANLQSTEFSFFSDPPPPTTKVQSSVEANTSTYQQLNAEFQSLNRSIDPTSDSLSLFDTPQNDSKEVPYQLSYTSSPVVDRTTKLRHLPKCEESQFTLLRRETNLEPRRESHHRRAQPKRSVVPLSDMTKGVVLATDKKRNDAEAGVAERNAASNAAVHRRVERLGEDGPELYFGLPQGVISENMRRKIHAPPRHSPANRKPPVGDRPKIRLTGSASLRVNDFCKFCLKNGEPENLCRHLFKDIEGRVVCPVLNNYKCEICGATGSVAHTRKHCPLHKAESDVIENASFRRLSNGVISTSFNHK